MIAVQKPLLAGLALLCASGLAQAQLTFNFTFVPGTSAAAQQGFVDAAARWSSLFNDPVTLDMTVGTQALGPSVLAQAGSASSFVSYSALKAALNADKTSASDTTAVSNLQTGNNFNVMLNRTTDSPHGAGSATPYVASGSQITLTHANAKALGLAVGPGTVSGCIGNCDALLVFSNAIAFDFNGNDGITTGQFDFVGIAAHEIGHAMGFISGADIIDNFANQASASVFSPYTTSLDLFRYSANSTAMGAVDISADTRSKYFSIDGGTTVGAGFSTGESFGDGRQASHWKDSLGLGLLDPTAGHGELLQITANDIVAFDVMGWNLVTAVPEPGTYALFACGLAAMGLRRRALVSRAG